MQDIYKIYSNFLKISKYYVKKECFLFFTKPKHNEKDTQQGFLETNNYIIKSNFYSETNNKLILSVPYNEKEEAKHLGAFWDNNLKKWYATKDYYRFSKWFSFTESNLICNNLYLLSNYRECWRCKKDTRIHYLLTDRYYNINNGEPSNFVGKLSILSYSHYLDNSLVDLLSSFNIYYEFSQTTKEHYFMNHCEYCNAKLGDYYNVYDSDEEIFCVSDSMILYSFINISHCFEINCSYEVMNKGMLYIKDKNVKEQSYGRTANDVIKSLSIKKSINFMTGEITDT